jgi:hypothetical protein
VDPGWLYSKGGEDQMNTQKLVESGVDPDGKWLYRVGGISALVLGAAYIAIIVLYIPMGAPPAGAEAKLLYLAGNTTAWWVILALSVLTDFLFVPLALALYLALKGIDRNMMLLATAFVGLFVFLDLAITWTNYAALIVLSSEYTAASDALRPVLLAAVYPLSSTLESDLLFVYNTLILAIGILLTGLVMRKGIFSRTTAYLGVVTGILGIVAVLGPILVSALSATILLTSLLTTVWVVLAGIQLHRLGRQDPLG